MSYAGTPTMTRVGRGRWGLTRRWYARINTRFDAEIYQHRNVVERAINKLKAYRAVASRYDKRDYMYRGTIDIASIRIWLRDPVPHPRDTL